MNRVTRWIGEMWPMPAPWLRMNWSAMRTTLADGLMGRPSPQNTTVNYNLARSLYRNDNVNYQYGAGFIRPVIDLMVEYMGMPYVTTDDSTRDTFLNEAIHDHWAPELGEVVRAALRDSKTVVRFRQPHLDNPLFTEEDRMHGRIECVPPEMADITFDPTDPDLVMRGIFTHFINFDERSADEVSRGVTPRIKEHEIHEIITPEKYEFWDKTMDQTLDSWGAKNLAGFVPAWPIYNEWDATLGSGISEIEPILPFVKAFHDVLSQSLTAHKYHSTPKAKFKLKDVYTFLQNNYQDVLDPATGKLKDGATINWTGKEIFLMNHEEDIDFIEATSVLGDSKTLLDFLIDCIAIASETPKWALLKSETAGANDASIVPFEKKIARKRVMFNPLYIMLAKMALVTRGQKPVTVRCSWPTIRVTDLAAKGQAIQQIVMAFDVAAQHEWVADTTVIQILSTLFPEISEPDIEKARAASNVVIAPPPAPASSTQGNQAPSSNGSGNKKSAKKAVATATGGKGS